MTSKPTPGPVELQPYDPEIDADGSDRVLANARLIADAFNVFGETGLTPRQLADKIASLRGAHEVLRKSWDESLKEVEAQRDELLVALKDARDVLLKVAVDRRAVGPVATLAQQQAHAARAAIAKMKNQND